MTGLEDRLRRVPGIVDLTVELGEAGLDGLRIRIAEGADEGQVLDEIRRILVTYGLASRPSGAERRPLRRLDAEIGGAPASPQLTVGPRGDGLEVALVVGGRAFVAEGERSPFGAVTAMARVLSLVLDRPMPRRIGIVRDHLDGLDVVTVVVRSGEVAGVGAALASPSLSLGIYYAVGAALTSAA